MPKSPGLPGLTSCFASALVSLALTGAAHAATPSSAAGSPGTLALVGATVLDLSNDGRSTNDLRDSVVLLRGSTIVAVGSRASVAIPRGAKVVDLAGKFLIPGLVDGFAGMNSQAQANANLYMGVTTVVASGDDRRGELFRTARPSPHLYLVDSAGTTDDYSLLRAQPQWRDLLKDPEKPARLDARTTERQLEATARLGTRVIWLSHYLTAAQTRAIIARAHQLHMITYGEFVSTPFAEGLRDHVDVLLHMSRYELGLVPTELQRPLIDDPDGPSARPVYAYLLQLDPGNLGVTRYAMDIRGAGTALMPTFSLEYLQLPGHRNLWLEPAAAILDPKGMYLPADRTSGEAVYPTAVARERIESSAVHFWAINQTMEHVGPRYLAASGAAVFGSMPGISMHTEMDLLVRLGLTPRAAIAAATSNYSSQFGWRELGAIEAGRRADLVVLDDDPSIDIRNSRHIHAVFLSGTPLDRDALLR